MSVVEVGCRSFGVVLAFPLWLHVVLSQWPCFHSCPMTGQEPSGKWIQPQLWPDLIVSTSVFCWITSVLPCLFPLEKQELRCGKERWASGIINIIHETSTFYMPVTSEAFRVEVASLGILVCLTLDSLNLQHLPGLGVLHHFSGISFSSREKKKVCSTKRRMADLTYTDYFSNILCLKLITSH